MNMSHTTSAHHHPVLRRVLVVCGTLAAIAVSAGCGHDSTPSLAEFAPDHSQTVPGAAALPAITPIACDPASAAPGETVTRARGDHDSGIGAVADYHWSVITARDPARAADAIAPGSQMGRAQNLTDAFGGFPPGTTYCLRMRQTDARTVLFTLDYKPPTGTDAQYKLRATVAGTPGSVRMTGEVDQ